jgi:hypothetical protein
VESNRQYVVEIHSTAGRESSKDWTVDQNINDRVFESCLESYSTKEFMDDFIITADCGIIIVTEKMLKHYRRDEDEDEDERHGGNLRMMCSVNYTRKVDKRRLPVI